MKPIVFLDIDGVLNDHTFNDADDIKSSTLLPGPVACLNRILRTTDARIVLSSAWRYMIPIAMSERGFEYLLRTHGVGAAGRVLARTVADETVSLRGEQISEWLFIHRPDGCPYVVIDDGGKDEYDKWTGLGIEEAGHPVVWTDGKVGLTEADADRAIAILARAAEGGGK